MKMKTWVKNGLIGATFGFVINLLNILSSNSFNFGFFQQYIFPEAFFSETLNHYLSGNALGMESVWSFYTVLSLIEILIYWFLVGIIIGALIGWIYGRFKK